MKIRVDEIQVREGRRELDGDHVRELADSIRELGLLNPVTVELQIQTAKNLTPEAKEIIKDADTKITKKAALKLSRLKPEQQKDTPEPIQPGEAKQEPEKPALLSTVPYVLPEGGYTTIKESVAALKNPNIDCSCTPDSFLAEFTAFVRKYLREIEWYSSSYYEAAYPAISPEQLDYLRQQMDSVQSANGNLINQIERNMEK